MCMDNRNKFGEIFVYFSKIKRYPKLSKKSADLYITLPNVYHL